MAEIKELEVKMRSLMEQLKETVEMSIELLRENPNFRGRVVTYWQDFGRHFISYIKKREKETGEEILGDLSLTSLLKSLRRQ